MANEKLLLKLSTIDRCLGKLEGVAFCLDDKYANVIFDALEVLNAVLEDIKDGK